MNQKTRNVIAMACEQMRCSFEDEAAYMQVLIHECLKTMYSSKNLNKYSSATIEVVDNKALLPDSCLELIRVNTSRTMDAFCNLCADVDYVVQGGVIIFSTGLDIEDGTEYFIQFKSFLEDEHGNLDFDARWERMLVDYICWRYCQKYPEKYDAGLRNDYHRGFITQKQKNR